MVRMCHVCQHISQVVIPTIQKPRDGTFIYLIHRRLDQVKKN